MINSTPRMGQEVQAKRPSLEASASYDSVMDYSKYLSFKDIHLSTIQSLIIIAIALIYNFGNDSKLMNNLPLGLIILSIVFVTLLFSYLFRGKKTKLKSWHLLIILSVVTLVFNYETTVHAQILDGIDGALGDVGTAAGGSFATTVLDAIIDLIRITVYIAVAGAVIAGIIFGVAQGQWQAPVLVIGVIIAIGLFLEIMGAVVFG